MSSAPIGCASTPPKSVTVREGPPVTQVSDGGYDSSKEWLPTMPVVAPLDSEDSQCDGLAALSLHVEGQMEQLDVSIEDYEETVLHVKIWGYPRDMGQVIACTGQTLWKGGESLARWCWRTRHDPLWRCQACLELGAGLGLCSLVAEKCAVEASVVVGTDGDDLALECMRRNVALNASSRVAVRKLQWGDSAQANRIKAEFGARKGFDLLLAADVIYNERALLPFCSTVVRLLADPGILALSFTHRGVNLESLQATAAQVGLYAADFVSREGSQNSSAGLGTTDGLLFFSRSS